MTQGILITPHFTLRDVTVDTHQLRPSEAIPVAFGDSLDYLGYPVEDDGTPNPAASLARNQKATGNPAFFADPTSAVRGDVVCVRADGADLTGEDRAAAEETVRAAKVYCEDYPEEYALWHSAAGWR
ncbi:MULTISPECIES: hypothetical protein [unclassified Corynebacterium]|uniref:hypothetical protein n=1 Tax=unclassified Corynebacterium TaxID=2624378 RepID=UPI0029C9EB20|nr:MULTISPECIES: hypothetical protein [unclassified Corynebacterium]WPF66543.1 hypothetical protein OLX12_02095 [Corynebacterium sp. 22KM0430]WPF69032.1 hypothetical protein OLW90_02090 [Corynebacterium sp. 21KM1197]